MIYRFTAEKFGGRRLFDSNKDCALVGVRLVPGEDAGGLGVVPDETNLIIW